MGVCVPNFRSVSLLVWPGGVTQINKTTNKYIHTYTSEFKNILDRLLASREFWYWMVEVLHNSFDLEMLIPNLSRTFSFSFEMWGFKVDDFSTFSKHFLRILGGSIKSCNRMMDGCRGVKLFRVILGQFQLFWKCV